ncbi:transposase [Alkalihalobacillus sp. NPDC078783]
MTKKYSLDYREYVAKLIIEEGKKASDMAYELEVHVSSIHRWVHDYKKKQEKPNSGDYLTPSEVEKLKKHHEKEMLSLREENEILKKAMHIFTQKPK